jgi:hypothetical protein
MFDKNPNPTPQLVKKFYFLDYFLILLHSIEDYDDRDHIFAKFKTLKGAERLGESKYLKLTNDEENLSEHQVKRYRYTFDQVIMESLNYNLIKEDKNKLHLTESGKKCLDIGKKSKRRFYKSILYHMESKYYGFYHLVNACYKENKAKNGLLIFPVYSPLKLGFTKSEMKTNGDWLDYSAKLKKRLELDIELFLEKTVSLTKAHETLLNKLEEDKILLSDRDKPFNQSNYNSIISRFRKFWLNYFLKNLYNYHFSFDTFNLWAERGNQLGIIHSTEVYPDFNGRLVFPTAIITRNNTNADLVNMYEYENGEKLFIHRPDWKIEANQDEFIKTLVDIYFDLRRNRRTHFIRLSDLRERVCYKMRIGNFIFNDFMEKAYNMNLHGNTGKMQISLEADRLPHESNALYLKREPVLVNGLYKNIIAIDFKK